VLLAATLSLLALVEPGLAQARTGASTHTVKKGDTLSSIAKKHGTDVDKLLQLNRMKADHTLHPGDVVVVAKGKGKAASASSAKSRRSSKDDTRPQYHTVKKGDTLSGIAKRYGTDVKALKRLNKRGSLKVIHPGDRVVVGRTSSPVAGKLSGAVQLPDAGPGFVAPRRDRVWGKAHAIEAIQTACAEVERQYPGTVPAYIGDVSFESGGRMRPHKSHQKGIDVDISYFHSGNKRGRGLGNTTAATLDAEKTWSLIQAFLDTGVVESMYIDYRLQRPLYEEAKRRGIPEAQLAHLFEFPDARGSGRTRTIRHIRGHATHLHVRFVADPNPSTVQRDTEPDVAHADESE
jgi:LysM repeat protein